MSLPSPDTWDRLVGIVEKNAGFIHPKSPYREALEANINKAVSGQKLDVEAFQAYTTAVEEQAKEWGDEWGGEEEESDDEEEQSGEEQREEQQEEEEEGDSEDLQISPDDPLVEPVSALVRCFNQLPPPEYTGLFPAFALMNHSCCPNVEVREGGREGGREASNCLYYVLIYYLFVMH